MTFDKINHSNAGVAGRVRRRVARITQRLPLPRPRVVPLYLRPLDHVRPLEDLLDCLRLLGLGYKVQCLLGLRIAELPRQRVCRFPSLLQQEFNFAYCGEAVLRLERRLLV